MINTLTRRGGVARGVVRCHASLRVSTLAVNVARRQADERSKVEARWLRLGGELTVDRIGPQELEGGQQP
jgi:hypothetical protein